MDEKLTIELDTQFNLLVSSSSNSKHEDKMLANFDCNDNSHCDITNSSKTVTRSNSQSVCNDDIKEDNENSDIELEVLLLDMKEQEGNSVWDDDVNDFTEEQENYLLNEDCAEHYIKIPDICNLNKGYTIDHEDKLSFVETPPINHITYDQQFEGDDISISSKSDVTNAIQDENLDISEANENVEGFSIVPSNQFKLKKHGCNSEIKSSISSYFSDAIENEDNVVNLDNENSTKGDIISDTEDEDVLFIDENYDSEDPCNQSAYIEYACSNPCNEPADVIINQNTGSSSSNSCLLDEDGIDEEKTEDRVNPDTANRQFALSKVMSSNSARRVYLDLLKGKTQSLFISYNRYKNAFLQSTSRVIDELELDKSFKNEENLSEDSFHDTKVRETKLLDQNTNVSTFNTQSLNIFGQKANDESTTPLFTTQPENSVEEVTWPTVPVKNIPEDDLRQLQIKENQNKLLSQTTPKPDNKDMKDITSKTPMLEKRGTDGLVDYISDETASYDIADRPESTNGDVLETLSTEPQQNANMEDLCDQQKCKIPKRFSVNEGDGIHSEGEILNEISQAFPESKYTEIVNNSLYTGYEAMDSQAINIDSNKVPCCRCESIYSYVDESDASHSELKFQKKMRHSQIKNLKSNFNTQTLLDLFGLNNKIVTNILSALLSEQFKKGALLTDIMKYLKRETALEIKTKLKQDIINFLKAAVDAGIIQMKYRRYILIREKGLSDRRKTTNKDKKREITNKTLRSLRPRASKNK